MNGEGYKKVLDVLQSGGLGDAKVTPEPIDCEDVPYVEIRCAAGATAILNTLSNVGANDGIMHGTKRGPVTGWRRFPVFSVVGFVDSQTVILHDTNSR